MKKLSLVCLISISCILVGNILAQDIIQCGSNNIQCVRDNLDSVKSIEVKKTELNGGVIIEETQIKITNDNQAQSLLDDVNSKSTFSKAKEKSLHAVADIYINKFKSIKENPKNSILKELIVACPNLGKSKSIKKLEGKKAQCQLNKNVTVNYAPKDIYWCAPKIGCVLGPYPKSSDERLRLISDGLSRSFQCDGSLIKEVKSICKINEWKISTSF